MDEQLMNESQFNELVRQWGARVRLLAQNTLGDNTHSTHSLQRFLTLYVDESQKTHAAYKVKFQFDRYGVFRAYGAGKGYVVYNGVLSRGFRLKTRSTYEQWEKIVKNSLALGMKSKQINALKSVEDGEIKRKPLNWLDQHIERNISSLADLVQGYYGDRAMRHILENFSNIMITKNG